MSTVSSPHIEVNDRGVARIAGTRTTVKLVVADYVYWGWTPDIIHRQHPYLSLAQIHAAFVYYYDHQAQIDAELKEDELYLEKMAKEAENSPLQQKLRKLKEQQS